MKYVLGIDGGSTKSHLAIFTHDGEFVGFHSYGALNHECMEGGFAELRERLSRFLEASLSGHGIGVSDVSCAVFGLAGNDNSVQYKIIYDIIKNTGLKNFALYNDAFLGIPAGCPDGAGICAINGTGCTIAAIDYEGSHIQVGGIGDLSRDMGGSSHMGAMAVGAVYSAIYRKEQATLLSEYIMEALGISKKEDFSDAISVKIGDGSFSAAGANSLIFAAAERGDLVALSILRDVAQNYAGGIAYIAESMSFPKEKLLTVVLAGSVFVKEKSPLLREGLERETASLLGGRDVSFVTLEAPPVAGAVMMALERAGGTFSRGKVCEVLRRG